MTDILTLWTVLKLNLVPPLVLHLKFLYIFSRIHLNFMEFTYYNLINILLGTGNRPTTDLRILIQSKFSVVQFNLKIFLHAFKLLHNSYQLCLYSRNGFIVCLSFTLLRTINKLK